MVSLKRMAESLIPIATFSRHIEAELARSKLEAEGLPAFVADSNIVRLNWFLSGAVGGAKVLVRAQDESRALEILQEDPQSAQEALREVFGDDLEDRCPQCGSSETRTQSAAAFRAAIALIAVALMIGRPVLLLLMPLPVIFYRRRRRCFDCGLRWRED